MKRFICVLSLLALLLSLATVSASADSLLYGDVNGDGKVNNRDLGLLQQHLNDWDVLFNAAVADVNDDGKINNRDLGLLQQYLNEWDVTLGPVVPDVPVDPEPDVPVDPEPDVPVDPEPDVPVDPEPDVPVDPEPDVPVDPEPDVPVDPEPDVPVDPEPDIPDFPAIELPEVGYDLDGRERIFIDSIVQNGNTVTITIANHSDKFMTEETCYVKYTCTDADGNALKLTDTYYGYIYFGMLEVGWSKNFTITLPEGTAKLEMGDYRIVYWTQWA